MQTSELIFVKGKQVFWTKQRKNEANNTFLGCIEIKWEASFFCNLDPLSLNFQTSEKSTISGITSVALLYSWSDDIRYQQPQALLCWPETPTQYSIRENFFAKRKQRWYAKFSSNLTSSPSLIIYCNQICKQVNWRLFLSFGWQLYLLCQPKILPC